MLTHLTSRLNEEDTPRQGTYKDALKPTECNRRNRRRKLLA
jgi:hypothetical protein